MDSLVSNVICFTDALHAAQSASNDVLIQNYLSIDIETGQVERELLADEIAAKQFTLPSEVGFDCSELLDISTIKAKLSISDSRLSDFRAMEGFPVEQKIGKRLAWMAGELETFLIAQNVEIELKTLADSGLHDLAPVASVAICGYLPMLTTNPITGAVEEKAVRVKSVYSCMGVVGNTAMQQAGWVVYQFATEAEMLQQLINDCEQYTTPETQIIWHHGSGFDHQKLLGAMIRSRKQRRELKLLNSHIDAASLFNNRNQPRLDTMRAASRYSVKAASGNFVKLSYLAKILGVESETDHKDVMSGKEVPAKYAEAKNLLLKGEVEKATEIINLIEIYNGVDTLLTEKIGRLMNGLPENPE